MRIAWDLPNRKGGSRPPSTRHPTGKEKAPRGGTWRFRFESTAWRDEGATHFRRGRGNCSLDRENTGPVAGFRNPGWPRSPVKGKSMLAMSRDLGTTYKTSVVLAHKIREDMASEVAQSPIGGAGKRAEIDGGYFGGYVRPANRRENRQSSMISTSLNASSHKCRRGMRSGAPRCWGRSAVRWPRSL